jgi:hypothetical protein
MRMCSIFGDRVDSASPHQIAGYRVAVPRLAAFPETGNACPGQHHYQPRQVAPSKPMRKQPERQGSRRQKKYPDPYGPVRKPIKTSVPLPYLPRLGIFHLPAVLHAHESCRVTASTSIRSAIVPHSACITDRRVSRRLGSNRNFPIADNPPITPKPSCSGLDE